MDKRKIVVGETFLHSHQGIEQICIAEGKMSQYHVVVDIDDWHEVIDFFKSNPTYVTLLADHVAGKKENTEKPESQKCNQAGQAPAEEKEIRDLIDIRKFALDKAQQILTSNGRTTDGSSVMSLAEDIVNFIIKGL